jgi:hypothetical protein
MGTFRMLPAIDLDGEFGAGTGNVENIGRDRMLATEAPFGKGLAGVGVRRISCARFRRSRLTRAMHPSLRSSPHPDPPPLREGGNFHPPPGLIFLTPDPSPV